MPTLLEIRNQYAASLITLEEAVEEVMVIAFTDRATALGVLGF